MKVVCNKNPKFTSYGDIFWYNGNLYISSDYFDSNIGKYLCVRLTNGVSRFFDCSEQVILENNAEVNYYEN